VLRDDDEVAPPGARLRVRDADLLAGLERGRARKRTKAAPPPIRIAMAGSRTFKDDNAKRKAETGRGGYWIETASGPPYFVAAPPAPRRFRNSGA
jgi:hypothetical protein